MELQFTADDLRINENSESGCVDIINVNKFLVEPYWDMAFVHCKYNQLGHNSRSFWRTEKWKYHGPYIEGKLMEKLQYNVWITNAKSISVAGRWLSIEIKN